MWADETDCAYTMLQKSKLVATSYDLHDDLHFELTALA